MDLILIPAILHITPAELWAMHWLVQERMRRWLQRYIGAGWGGNPDMVQRKDEG